MKKTKSLSLFLLPHQDDEYPIASRILFEQTHGNSVFFCFLTTGKFGKNLGEQRNKESLRALKKLGVDDDQISFLGSEFGISDQHLVDNVGKIVRKLKGMFKDKSVENIYVPAWEGGHPDHDVAAAIGCYLSKYLSIEGHCFQYSLYNAHQTGIVAWPFHVHKQIASNGSILTRIISFREAMRISFLFLYYKSQFITWLALAPIFLRDFLILRRESLQVVTPKIFQNRPHEGTLYYEKRWETDFSRLHEVVLRLLDPDEEGK